MKTFLLTLNVGAARFARRAYVFFVLYIVYLNGGNIHGPQTIPQLLPVNRNANRVLIWHLINAREK